MIQETFVAFSLYMRGSVNKFFTAQNEKQTLCVVIFFGQRINFQGQKSKKFMHESLLFFQDWQISHYLRVQQISCYLAYEYKRQEPVPRRGLAPPVLIFQTSPPCNIFTKNTKCLRNRCQPSHKGLILGRLLVQTRLRSKVFSLGRLCV